MKEISINLHSTTEYEIIKNYKDDYFIVELKNPFPPNINNFMTGHKTFLVQLDKSEAIRYIRNKKIKEILG